MAAFSDMNKILSIYNRLLKSIVLLLAVVSALAVLAMVVIIVLDVVLRMMRFPLTGAYDLVKVAGTIAIAASFPYTTAVRGHVAIEYFFHKFNRRGRAIIDTLVRLLAIAFFGCASWQAFNYGSMLKASGQVSLTLQMPFFWLAYLISGIFVVVVLVIFENMLHPGKELIKP